MFKPVKPCSLMTLIWASAFEGSRRSWGNTVSSFSETVRIAEADSHQRCGTTGVRSGCWPLAASAGRACSRVLAIPTSKRHKKQFFEKLIGMMTFLETQWPERPSLRRSDPTHIKTEERVRVGMEANLGIRRPGLDQRRALVVHSNAHRLYWTNPGVQNVSHRHDIVECWSLRSPFVVKQGQHIGQRRAGTKQDRSLRFVKLHLCRVEWHHVKRHPRSKKLSRRGNVVNNIPFRLRSARREIFEIAVTSVNRAPHQHNPPQLEKSFRLLLDQSAHIYERTDRYQGNLPRIAAYLLRNEIHCSRMRSPRKVPTLSISPLSKDVGCMSRSAHGHRNTLPPTLTEHPVQKPGPRLRISISSRDADNLQLGATQRQRHRESVIHIIANIGIDDDFLGSSGQRRLRLNANGQQDQKNDPQICNSFARRKNSRRPTFSQFRRHWETLDSSWRISCHRSSDLPLHIVAHIAAIQTHVNRGVRDRCCGLDEQDPECLSGLVNSAHHFGVRNAGNLVLRKRQRDLLTQLRHSRVVALINELKFLVQKDCGSHVA